MYAVYVVVITVCCIYRESLASISMTDLAYSYNVIIIILCNIGVTESVYDDAIIIVIDHNYCINTISCIYIR